MADNMTPTIVALIRTFSDYGGAIGRLHQDALTKYVDKHVELCIELEPVLQSVAATEGKAAKDIAAPTLGAKLRDMAVAAGKQWTLSDANLAKVLWFGRWHTAKRLATYSAAKIKADETPTINGYSGWLGKLSRKEIDESGAATADGIKADKERATKAAKLAVAKPAMVTTTDYLKDVEGLAELEQLRALELLKVNLEADIALLERKMGKSKKVTTAIEEMRKAVKTARRQAANV